MARPRLEIGEWGKITITQLPDGRHKATCRFRGIDGKVRPAEATAPTKTKAERALKDRVKQRIGDRGGDITPTTPLPTLAAKWWEKIEERTAAGDLNPDTRLEYQRYKNYVVEACGDLILRECTVHRLETAIKGRAGGSPRTESEMKRALVGMFREAVRLGAMDTNPALSIDVSKAKSGPARALTLDELEDMRARIRAYENSGGPNAPRDGDKGRGGKRRSKFLADFFEVQLASSTRIGETLALRWEDIHGLDKDHGPVTVEIAGTLKHRSRAEAKRTGLPVGLYRQEWPKTESGHRVVTLPHFGGVVLRRLWKARKPGSVWVFATSRGTPLNPSNVRTALRKARGEEYEWVTPHTLRRTGATTIADGTGSAQLASTVLGHASTGITETYIDRKRLASDASVVMQLLAPKVVDLVQSVGSDVYPTNWGESTGTEGNE